MSTELPMVSAALDLFWRLCRVVRRFDQHGSFVHHEVIESIVCTSRWAACMAVLASSVLKPAL